MRQEVTTVTTDLAAFLLAQIEEDEAAARWATGRAYGVAHCRKWVSVGRVGGISRKGPTQVRTTANEYARDFPVVRGSQDICDHVARWDPARVLAECEAKRRIVETASEKRHNSAGSPAAVYITDVGRPWLLRLLALPYADHPDYCWEWTP